METTLKYTMRVFLIVGKSAFADVMLGVVSLPLYIYLWVGPTHK